jgi:Concanavalin A-like lectin/glucanases superfamily
MNLSRIVFRVILPALTILLGFNASAQQTATATATLDGIFVTQVTVTFGGSGYGWAPLVSFTGGGGTGAGAYATVSDGVVAAITVTNAGSGYTSPPQVQIAPPSTTPFSDSLVLDLPLNGSVVDMGPNGFNVLDNGGGTWVPDQNLRANSALSLNGVNQNIVVPYDVRLFPAEMTWSAWVNFQNFNLTQLWVMGGSLPFAGGGLQLQSGGLNYTDFNGTGFNADFDADYSNFQANTWCQIVVTRSTTNCEMFVNGLKVGSQTGLTSYTVPHPPTAWSFGANVA